MKPPTLTIVIPTYARNAVLLRTLPRLIPQLDDACRLVILDNHSPRPVAPEVAELLGTLPDGRAQVRRNVANIGADANILRAFEIVETPWLWILGDDDEVSAEAVATILRTIAEHPEAAYLSFLRSSQARAGLRRETKTCEGLEAFCGALDHASQLNFMSCSVWRAGHFLPALREGYRATYSMGWSFALLVAGLREGGIVVFSDRAIIDEDSKAEATARWSFRRFLLGWPTVLEGRLTEGQRRILSKKLLGFYTPEIVSAYLLADSIGLPASEAAHHFRLVRHRMAPYRVHTLGRTRYALCGLLFIEPRAGWWIVKRMIAGANRAGWKNIDIADMEGRRGQ